MVSYFETYNLVRTRQVTSKGLLVLEDGQVFEGILCGATPEGGFTCGEVVFNTSMSGYQEIITDPSYAGQIICFTYTHIGNYGITPLDDESSKPFCRGIVVRNLSRRPSSWRSAQDIQTFMEEAGLPAIASIDTRRLTRHVRQHGSIRGAFGSLLESELKEIAQRASGTQGVDLAREVTCETQYQMGSGRLSVVAYDFGIKSSILNQLSKIASVTVVPASTPYQDVLDAKVDGVFLSNGPGDPSAVGYGIDNVKHLLGRVPIFGICLGHQILATALGAKTFKLEFGHHGANHPVRNLSSQRVEITSQNHNYAVSPDLPSGLEVTHVNLNDHVVEGIASRDYPAFGVQYHPEAGPGPHDGRYLFDDFARLMDAFRQDHNGWADESAKTVTMATGPVELKGSL